VSSCLRNKSCSKPSRTRTFSAVSTKAYRWTRPLVHSSLSQPTSQIFNLMFTSYLLLSSKCPVPKIIFPHQTWLIHGVHCAGLSDFSVIGAARRHFSRQVAQLFRMSSESRMNVESAYALNTRYILRLPSS
jgi:hypothetical protein